MTIANSNGWTPLNTASSNGHLELVKLTLENGAEINALGDLYCDALQAASSGDCEAVLKLLLEKGADSTVANKDGSDRLM